MKKIVIAFTLFSTVGVYNTANAQDEKRKEKEIEEITIQKKGDKDTDLVVEIKGDKITVNGKPLSEFKDENIKIKKGKITIRGREGMAFNFNDDFPQEWKEENMTSKAFLGVTTDDDDEEGAKITDVTGESAAEKAGLQKGDIITKIDDKQISASTLSEIIADYKPKDNIKVYYKRDGKEKNAKVTLGETKRGAMSFAFRTPEGKLHSFSLPKIPGAPPKPPMPPGEVWEGQEFRDLEIGGLEGLESIGDIFGHRQKLGLKIQDMEEGNGIKVLGTQKDSPAEKAGLQKDDIVTEIGGKKINNTDDAREQLHEMHDKPSYSIKAKRNGSEMTFDIKVPKKLKTANL